MKLRICLAAFFFTAIIIAGFRSKSDDHFDVNKALGYCVQQSVNTSLRMTNPDSIPRTIAKGQKNWGLVNYRDWCSGYSP